MEVTFLQDVKNNCDISDAHFWGYFSICGLLMRYRDLYRAEQGLDPWSPVRRGDISLWISAKEARWPELKTQTLRHELAESRESMLTWKDIIAKVDDRGAEHFLRAVQDLIADTSDSGPLTYIVNSRDAGALALYTGLQEGYRRLLFSGIRDAAALFREKRDWSSIDETRRQGHSRFLDLRREVLALHDEGDRDHFLAGVRLLAGRSDTKE
ncbi:MAG: hypothetical protein OEW15_02915 [Nitrospirota bacterium]|nr:hypothetical protein [Nitrospirota bacterium]